MCELVSLTLRIYIKVVHKVRDGVVERCGRDAIVVFTVIHKLQSFSLVHSDQNVIVEELPLMAKEGNNKFNGQFKTNLKLPSINTKSQIQYLAHFKLSFVIIIVIVNSINTNM